MAVHHSRATRVALLALAVGFIAPSLTLHVASAASLMPLVVQASEVASTYGAGF